MTGAVKSLPLRMLSVLLKIFPSDWFLSLLYSASSFPFNLSKISSYPESEPNTLSSSSTSGLDGVAAS